jgi:hypothetical protein
MLDSGARLLVQTVWPQEIQMEECCPHCGARLPFVRDQYCGECRADLSELPVQYEQSTPLLPPLSKEELASDHNRARRMAAILSLLIYACLIVVLFSPDVRTKAVEAFGRQPLGLPVLVFVGGLQTLLYIPIPWGFYHFALIQEQARRDGRLMLGFGGLFYLMEVDSKYPHLTRSKWICLASLGYFFAVVAVWIVYTAALGI